MSFDTVPLVLDVAATEARSDDNMLLMDMIDKSVLHEANSLNFKTLNNCEVHSGQDKLDQPVALTYQPNCVTSLSSLHKTEQNIILNNSSHCKRKRKPRRQSVSDTNCVSFSVAKNILPSQLETKPSEQFMSASGKCMKEKKSKRGPENEISKNKLIILKEMPAKVQNQNCYPILIMKMEDDHISLNDQKSLPDYTDQNQAIVGQDLSIDIHHKKKETNIESKLKFFKCYACPFITLSKDMLTYHLEKKDKCFESSPMYGCPGCQNAFLSQTSLRVHLVHDHRMPVKEVRLVLQNLNEQSNLESDKSSCAYGSGTTAPLLMNGTSYTLPDSNISASQELSLCASGKRPTMLESYLDVISTKAGCSLPPSLSQTGSDLLENTFNFTAPVSEQLPAIEPPPSTTPLDLHGNHSFLNMANVFSHDRDQVEFKAVETEHYTDQLLAGGAYLDGDIPVINIECEGNLMVKPADDDKADLQHPDAQAFHFPDYHDDGTGDRGLSEDEEQDEKKGLKKLGVGFRCDINGCKVRLQSEKNIQYHRRCHEGTLYNCPECCKDCPTWVSLSSHLWQAHKIDMELYRCDQCPYKTPSYSRLTNIHRGIHGNARPFLCDVCGKGFKTVKQMRNHKNTHKAKMVRMVSCRCPVCGRTLADKRLLELHVNNTHEKKKPYLCYICGYASAVKHTLMMHMRRHTGEKPYRCEKCDYKTADHNSLRRHNMKHTGARNYKCSRCNYTCIQATTYRVHVKTKHPGLETDVIFSCDQCNFQTINRGSFQLHISEHGPAHNELSRRHEAPAPSLHAGYATELGPIISDGVVETIVDLSGAHNLLEDDLYEVEHITGDLEQPILQQPQPPQLKYKPHTMV